MGSLGYEQYEVSNYARPGKQCAHNINTWSMDQWMGLGPSAASQIGGRRYSNVPDLEKWRDGLANGEPEQIEHSKVTRELLQEDALIFGLRMNEGVDSDRLRTRFGMPLSEKQECVLNRLETDGKVVREGSQIRVTDSGRLVVDGIGAEVMA